MAGTPAPLPAADLQLAARLADAGRLEDARQICETHLREAGPSAQAFYLLGLVRDARGEDGEAGEFYRKAVYLDPHHGEALLHLALRAERDGDPAAARTLRKRARRARERSAA